MKGKNKERTSRSQNYQHLFVESTFPHELLESFCTADGIGERLNPFGYSEEILDLQDQLKVEFWRVVDAYLTPRQKQVIKLYSDGYTQMEIARFLNVNQSSITKSLNGNVDYSSGKSAVYGGSRKKLRKIVEQDEKIKAILARIAEIRSESWM